MKVTYQDLSEPIKTAIRKALAEKKATAEFGSIIPSDLEGSVEFELDRIDGKEAVFLIEFKPPIQIDNLAFNIRLLEAAEQVASKQERFDMHTEDWVRANTTEDEIWAAATELIRDQDNETINLALAAKDPDVTVWIE